MIKIKSINKDANHRIFYKDALLRQNRHVTFTAWNEDGETVFSNESAFNIFDSGSYYYNFTTPNIDSYLLIIGSDGSDPQGISLKIGEPSNQLVFYLHSNLTEDLIINYEIYDENSNILDEDIMTNIAGGFYYINVNELAEPWFLRVN
jgi:hypothetical protein